MSPAAVALWLALADDASSPSAVRYPLGEKDVPDLVAPRGPFQLVDLRYSLSDTDTTTHAFAARVKVRDWGYLAAETEGERRSLSVANQRLFLGVSSDQGNWGAAGEYRARHFLLGADARQHDDAGTDGWHLGTSLSLRLTRDLELLGDMGGDTAKPDDRFLRTVGAGALWQWRSAIEALGAYRREYVVTDAGDENKVDSVSADFVAQIGAAEISGQGSIRDTDGRFPRHETGGTLGARVSAAPRLLVAGFAGGTVERGASTQSHAYGGSVTWFARRFTLPRSGDVARRELAMAREATAAGYNERRVFGDDALRAQRERLALSPTRNERRDTLEDLHRAQVDERLVPVLGIAVEDRAEALTGASVRSIVFSLGVPWPPAPPWRANEAATPFLNLAYARERHTSGLDFRAHTDRVTLTVSLDREIDLVVGWQRAQPTALDLIRGIGARTTFEAACVYAFGR
jgi:hypothetical protein